MLAHYAADTIAQIRRAPFATAIRVLTLAAGLACFVTAQAIAGFWRTSERHFADVERIFAVTTDLAFTNGTLATAELPLTNEHVAQYLESDFPELAAVARARVVSDAAMVSADERAVRLFRVDVDPAFLEIFALPFVAGDAREALREPGSVVLTEEAAARLFGDAPALGRRLRLSNSVDAFVTGVVAAIPEPSHMGRSATASLRFDMLVARERPRPPPFGSDEAVGAFENWLVLDDVTYVSLPADGSLTAQDVRRRLGAFASAHVPREQLEVARLELGLVPVTELLVKAGSSGTFLARTGFTVTTALSLLGALVLAIACANYASLTTAAALARTRSVAVRKAVGAAPLQIAGQHLFDATVLASAALLVASVAVIAVMPALRIALGIDIGLVLLDARTLAFVAALVPAVAVLGGLYPAITLAKQPPIVGLPDRGTRGRRASGVFAGVQFAAASFLLLAAIVTYLQNAALARSPAESPDPLLLVENFYTATGLHPDTLRRELQALEHVSSVTSMARPPWSGVNVLPLAASPAAVAQRSAIWQTVGQDFFATFGIELVAGRVFDAARGDDALPFLGDTAQPNNVVVDRTLARDLGFASPQAAVGELVYIPRELTAGFGGTAAQPLRIIGVVEDRLLTLTGAGARGSVYSFATPLPFQVVRIARPHVSGTLAEIDALWKRLVPSVALRRRFVHDIFAEKSAGHTRVNQALTVLTLFAYATAAIGLYSMAKLGARRRMREIAVRKVLGATTATVAALLLASFARPIVAASVAALPAGYVAARAYLNAFVEPIALGVLPFALCLGITLAVVGCTVLAEVTRAARSRPASVLRNE